MKNVYINKYYLIFIRLTLLCATGLLAGCSSPSDSSSQFNSSYGNDASKKYLYVVSGGCYGGGVALSTGSATVSRFIKATGEFAGVLMDYNSIAAGDMPVAVLDKDADHLLVVVENAGARHVDVINKDGSGLTTYLTNTTALSGVMHNMFQLTDGSLLISKATAIEKFNANKARITQGANPYINAPASSCAASTTLITSISALSNGKILYTHAAANPNNKFGLISSTGYAAAADCLAAQAAPTTTALPTSIIVHPSGKVLVAFGSVTAASNFIYSYDIDPTTNIVSNITPAYTDFSNVNGPSAMTVDPETQDVFVANATSTFNTIERFSYNSTTRTLTKTSAASYIPANIYTRCVSGMVVGE